MKDWKRDINLYAELVYRNLNAVQTALEINTEIQFLSQERDRLTFLSPEWRQVNEELIKHVSFVYALSSHNELLKSAEKLKVPKGIQS